MQFSHADQAGIREVHWKILVFFNQPPYQRSVRLKIEINMQNSLAEKPG